MAVGGQVIRVNAHAAGKNQKIRPLFQICPGSACNQVQVIIANSNPHDFAGVLFHLVPDHGFKSVLNPSVIDLTAGDDHADLFVPVGKQGLHGTYPV